MTVALIKALWLLVLSALLAALWLVEHFVLVVRAIRAGEPWWRAVPLPVLWAYRSGARFAAARWCVYLVGYGLLALLR